MNQPENTTRARGWTDTCGNNDCRTGWLQLWRRRSAPRFEGSWACSANCLQRLVAVALRGEMESWDQSPVTRPLRMPLGLILLSRGWISRQELQQALAAQRQAQCEKQPSGDQVRIGEWLCRMGATSEETIAKALAIQWNCPVLLSRTRRLHSSMELPTFFRQRYGLALVRRSADETAYLIGRCRAEHATARALEHMLRAPVEAAFAEDSAWRDAQAQDSGRNLLLEPGPDGAALQIAATIEQLRPRDARLIRIHDHLWLRMWPTAAVTEVRDLVLPLRASDYRRELLRAG